MRVFAELNEKGDRIDVYFRYDKAIKDAVKSVPGAKFVPKDKGGPLWRLPLDLTSARRLREAAGKDLELGIGLLRWGKEEVKKERNLRELSTADDIPVDQLAIASKLPKLAEWFRPYQRADVKFLASTNALNLLEPRLGKTTETIGAIYEAGLETGPHLVVTPSRTSIEDVWQYEWERWTDVPVLRWSGDETQTSRTYARNAAVDSLENGSPFAWVTTPNMLRSGLPDDLDAIEWNSFTIDEFHKTGLAETKNKFPQAANKINAKRKYALSGTPMGGRPIKLWGALHFLEPQAYTSKWRWADQWLEVERKKVVVGYNRETGQPIIRQVSEIKGIQEGREEQFYIALAPHSVRRLRKEVLPELPEKQWVDVWCEMTPKQRKQYDTFAADAEIRIEEHYLSATSILAEYTRLKQFANSYCEVEQVGVTEEDEPILKLRATPESGKLPYLLDKLAEVGIDPEDPAGEAQAIVTSQFKETADMVFDRLTELGIKCAKITGDVNKKGERAKIIKAFKHAGDTKGLRVLVMTTTAGGVAITADNVESVHILDETWVPDDQEQVADRAVNTSTLHQVTAFVYRSKDTIEEDIKLVTDEKGLTNETVLDLVRQGYRAKCRKQAA